VQGISFLVPSSVSMLALFLLPSLLLQRSPLPLLLQPPVASSPLVFLSRLFARLSSCLRLLSLLFSWLQLEPPVPFFFPLVSLSRILVQPLVQPSFPLL